MLHKYLRPDCSNWQGRTDKAASMHTSYTLPLPELPALLASQLHDTSLHQIEEDSELNHLYTVF